MTKWTLPLCVRQYFRRFCSSVGRLGALALFLEAVEDLEAVTSAVLFAGAKLRRQAEVLGLLFRADANVDHRADHLRQLSADIGRRQGASSRHGS